MDATGRWLGQTRRKAVELPVRNDGGVRALLSSAPSSGGLEITGGSSVGDRGKRTFDAGRSAEHTWRPSMRVMTEPDRADRPSGKLIMPQGPKPVISRAEQVHFDHANSRTSAEFGLKMDRKAAARDPQSGLPTGVKPSVELSVSDLMGRKKRVDTHDSGALRNGHGVSKPGDKLYASPEFAPGFFKEGGSIPGSTSGLLKSLPDFRSTKSNGFQGSQGPLMTTTICSGPSKSTAPPALPSTFAELTIEQRAIAKALASEVAAVRDLIAWEEQAGIPPP